MNTSSNRAIRYLQIIVSLIVSSAILQVRADSAPPSKPPSKGKRSLDSLWSFHPVKNPPVPEIATATWPRDPVDHFILKRVENAGLLPTQDATPKTLIRRLYNDLIGLPPNKKEVDDFVQATIDNPQSAIRNAVDRLLASPHFGERWGRHWLDVARYGESNGNDGLGRNPTFPHAWRYRDYVIDALNRDLPYDRFLAEQIAGDLLPANSVEERNRHLVATGFLALGSKPAKAMNNNFDMDVVDNQINVVSTGVMGLSVACARCHDHKHDPIPTRDYYALAGIFKSTETLWGKAANEKLTAPPTPLHQLQKPGTKPVPPPSETPAFPKDYAAIIQSLKPDCHFPLDSKPDSLQVQKEVSFNPKSLGNFKAGRLVSNPQSAIKNPQSYTVSFWFRNDTPNAERPITAYIFSRGVEGKRPPLGESLGIGGKHRGEFTGKLIVVNGVDGDTLIGPTVIPPKTWNHVVLVRDGKMATVYLNGETKPEIEAEIPPVATETKTYFVGARSDNFSPLAGNLGHFALFDRALTPVEAKQLHTASGQPVGTKSPGPAGDLAMGVRDRPKIEDCKINLNGDSKKLGKAVPRGFITASMPKENPAPKFDPKRSGRLELARWLTSEDHPQTSRVLANRIWLHLFGEGIVRTPDDFGVFGARPTHPELLDHLATRLVEEHNWSIKKFIRSLVLTRTYQLDSRADPKLIEADPNNNLNARHSRRRLDAESLRDAILAASGQLDRSPGKGSAIQALDVQVDKEEDLHKPSNHRSIYLCYLRNSPPKELAAFDLPDAIADAGKRAETTLPAQSLFLLNNPFVIEQSRHLADLLTSQTELTDQEKITLLYHRTLQRNPSPAEQSRAQTFIKSGGAWPALCQSLLATNEFRYID